jgi:hypothetical protein
MMNAYKLLNVDVSNQNSLDWFLWEQSLKYSSCYEYSANDAFKLDNYDRDDVESMLFLSGYAVITIYGEEIHCSAGTYIEIEPGITHSFDVKSYVTLIKFFSKKST